MGGTLLQITKEARKQGHHYVVYVNAENLQRLERIYSKSRSKAGDIRVQDFLASIVALYAGQNDPAEE